MMLHVNHELTTSLPAASRLVACHGPTLQMRVGVEHKIISFFRLASFITKTCCTDAMLGVRDELLFCINFDAGDKCTIMRHNITQHTDKPRNHN